MLSPVVFLVISLLTTSSGQSIDPSTVDPQTRGVWCTNQKASCPLLCTQIDSSGNAPTSNTCDSTTLAFSCVCSNGLQPNSTQFSQTIPFYECTEFNNQCADNCASGDSACVTQCRTANPCGAQNPVRVNVTSTTSAGHSATSSSTSSAAASTSSSSSGGFGGPSAPTDSGASSLHGFGQAAGTLSLVASLIAASAVLL